MSTYTVIHRPAALLATVALMAWATVTTSQEVAIDSDDIGGIVASADGPEAGVWVIAETEDFDTRYAKIVVTDDQGRYVVPDLPDANYDVWVRGYGLADSAKVAANPGDAIDLTAVVAANDLLALGCYDALKAAGLDCPGDVSVTGFNDMPFVDMMDPPLTTVRIPQYDIGAAAARAVLERLNGAAGEAETIVLPSTLVIRGSTAPLP